LPFLLVGPLTPDILAQNDFFLFARLPFGLFSVTGAFNFDPVARLYLLRPLAVNPAPRDVGIFSPRPTDSETLLAINSPRVDLIIYLFVASINKVARFSFAKNLYRLG
jgi:hypothetical protein